MLRIHRAERADRLVDALATVLADPLDDPFRSEVVAVPTRGVERWLTQTLATRLGVSAGTGRADGVCANVEFPFPGRVVGSAVAAATGVALEDDPWPPERSVWALLDVVDAALGEPWLAALAAHLGAGPETGPDAGLVLGRRFAAVRHVADLFDRYGVHRPAMIEAWAAGHDTDGEGRALPDDARWQAELWRRLRARLATPSPAERLPAATERLRAEPALLALPDRLSLFGLTRLPLSYLQVLRSIATARDVHLFLLHPSPVLWDRLVADWQPDGCTLPRRSDDPTVIAARNPLLATWGQDVREIQLVLATVGGDDPVEDRHHPGPPQVPRQATSAPSTSLLARLQAGIRADRLPPGPPRPGGSDGRAVLTAGDRSVQVHACHGPARQVEVLRDAITHLLDRDPTLEPRDIIVMCPDIDAFAPLIQATFGATATIDDDDDTAPGAPDGRPRDLHVRLADRSIRQTNPVLGAMAELLDLAGRRLTASQVVDFAGRDPVRRRFGFDDDDLARIEGWVASTGIRWGLDETQRAPFGLGRLPVGTWRAGLDRILTGVALDERGQHLVGGVLPFDDVDSGDIDLAGRVAEFLDRLQHAVEAFAAPLPLVEWVDALGAAADALTATAHAHAWQRAQLAGILTDVRAEAAATGVGHQTVALDRREVQALLADRLRGRPTRANFRTGHLTMCTLVPMRSVPHRVVCLLGLDDGTFPRATTPDGDDLLPRDPRVGDQDARREDRQLLLDAVLSATETLVVTYSGRDERTNVVRPPAVPLGELLDVVDATAQPGPDGTPARAAIVIEQPLQPFDRRNFVSGALTPDRAWSYDPVALAGARSAAGTRTAPGPFLPSALPPARRDLIELADLIAFVHHPVKAFLRQRLNLSLSDGDEEPSDAVAVELNSLERWGVGDRLLEARLAGVDEATARAAELARGLLPPRWLGTRIVADVATTVEGLAALAATVPPAGVPLGSVEVRVDLGGGRTLVGTVPDVAGNVVRTVTFSRIAPKHRLAAWVRLLALTAARPEIAYRVVTVGQVHRQAGQVAIGPLGADAPDRARAARRHLADLVDLYDRGLCEPLPIYCKSSAAWAAARARHKPGDQPARKEWTTPAMARWDNEDREREHTLVLDGARSFDDVLAAAPRSDEAGAGWRADEDSRFGRLACRLWDGVLAAEGSGQP